MEDRYNQEINRTYHQSRMNYPIDSPPSNQILEHQYLVLSQKYQQIVLSYNDIENKMEQLQQYTSNRLRQFDEESAAIISDKNRQIQHLSINLKEKQDQNYSLHLQKQKAQKEAAKLKLQLAQLQRDVRDHQFENERTFKSFSQSKNGLEQIIIQQNKDIESLRAGIKIQQKNCLHNQEELKQKTKEIYRILSEKQELQVHLQGYIARESKAREANYILKTEIEQLKSMFYKVEGQINNCDECSRTRMENQRLKQQINILLNQLHSKTIINRIPLQPTSNQFNNNYNSTYPSSQNPQPNSPYHNLLQSNYNSQPYNENIYQNFNKNYYQPYESKSNLKQSILSRCKTITDS